MIVALVRGRCGALPTARLGAPSVGLHCQSRRGALSCLHGVGPLTSTSNAPLKSAQLSPNRARTTPLSSFASRTWPTGSPSITRRLAMRPGRAHRRQARTSYNPTPPNSGSSRNSIDDKAHARGTTDQQLLAEVCQALPNRIGAGPVPTGQPNFPPLPPEGRDVDGHQSNRESWVAVSGR
jgi:hypothetical protein